MSYRKTAQPPERNANKERTLFGEHKNSGIHFADYDKIPVEVKGIDVTPLTSFADGHLGDILDVNIELTSYTHPTPVQKYAMPIVRLGRDLMSCAQTGSGKTAAFVLPCLSRCIESGMNIKEKPRTRAQQPYILILAPTRELAGQIYDECKKVCSHTLLIFARPT